MKSIVKIIAVAVLLACAVTIPLFTTASEDPVDKKGGLDKGPHSNIGPVYNPHPIIVEPTDLLDKGSCPKMRAALRALEEAREEMKMADQDFGGHREEALKACDMAIKQLRAALMNAPKFVPQVYRQEHHDNNQVK